MDALVYKALVTGRPKVVEEQPFEEYASKTAGVTSLIS